MLQLNSVVNGGQTKELRGFWPQARVSDLPKNIFVPNLKRIRLTLRFCLARSDPFFGEDKME